MGHDPPYARNDKPPGLRHGGHRFRVVSEVGLEQPLTLELFLQGTKRLIDVVVTNTDLHVVFTTFLGLICKELQEMAV